MWLDGIDLCHRYTPPALKNASGHFPVGFVRSHGPSLAFLSFFYKCGAWGSSGDYANFHKAHVLKAGRFSSSALISHRLIPSPFVESCENGCGYFSDFYSQ